MHNNPGIVKMDSNSRQQRQTAYKVWISNLFTGQFVKQPGEWEPNYVQFKNIKISRVNIIATVVDTFLSDDQNYSAISIDDGTACIQVRAFREHVPILKDVKKGDLVLVTGKIREYQNTIYILPEIVKPVQNPNLELLYKLELLATVGKPEILEIGSQLQNAQEIAAPTTVNMSASYLPPHLPPSLSSHLPPGLTSSLSNLSNAFQQNIVQRPSEKLAETPLQPQSNRQKIISIIRNSTDLGIGTKEVIEASGLDDMGAESIIEQLIKEGEIYMPRPGRLMAL